jgi:signal transduction histidine kinase
MMEELMSQAFDVVTDAITRLEREAGRRERLAALGRLSTEIAHEVRGPLSIIKASVDSLQPEAASPAAVREAAVEIVRQLARLDRIVTAMLDFARPLRLELAPVNVAALVWDAAGAVLDGWEVPLARIALQPQLGTIVTDGGRLRGVLANLLENARQSVREASRNAGVEAIEIGGRRTAGGRVLLWVEDRGVGVPEADLPHAFEPAFTTRRSGKSLGLALARRVVEALGGSIRMQSREGEGTRVEIDLPVDATLRACA